MRIENTIYLDHQSTTPLDSRILAEMMPYLESAFGNPHSADHALGWRAAQAVEHAAAQIAGLIGADADEIVITSGATESNNLALLGLGRFAAGGKRRRILVSAIEHKCVLAAARALREQSGYEVELLPVDDAGYLSLPALEERLDDDVLFVSAMAVNNEIGTVQNITSIYELVRSCGAVFHCDAAQAPCAIDLGNLASLSDLTSLSGHKIYGPKGIGALYIRRDLQDQIEPMIYGGGQQSNLRSGTVPVPLCVGMGAAAALAGSDEGKERREAVRGRRDRFVQQMTGLTWPVASNGPARDGRHPGNANLRFCGFSAQEILGALQPHLAASTGSACTSGIPEPSHVLMAIGLTSDEAESSIRFSLGHHTTDADVDDAVVLIDQTLSRLAEAGLVHTA
jgi:cysteine desulfurase